MNVAVPILMYHEVTPHPLDAYRKYSVTPAELARQLAWLCAEGYTAVDMDAVRDGMRGTRALPARPVAITFDDGSRDCLEHGVPVLTAHGVTATFFIVAGLVGATTRWLLAERGFELPTADWTTLRAAEQAGMRCEAHSVTHPRLATLSAGACRVELTRAREVIEEGVGHAINHLAYPFGSFSGETRDIAAEVGYHTACTVERRLATPEEELLALPRIPVLGGETMQDFALRIGGGDPVRTMQGPLSTLSRRFGMGTSRDPTS
ncbi:MAG: polysaccharide deacetylase family protein [Gemmatimonadaceae bacterium]